MLEFVDSDLYFVQDKNNLINPLFQVGSGSGVPKITGSSSLVLWHGLGIGHTIAISRENIYNREGK